MDEREYDAVIDAGGATLSFSLVDAILGKVITASGKPVLFKGNTQKLEGALFVSAPRQRNNYLSCLYRFDTIEELEKARAEFVHNGADWLVDPGFREDGLRVEYAGRAGLIKNLSATGW